MTKNVGRPNIFGTNTVSDPKGAAWDAVSFVTDYMIPDKDGYGTNEAGEAVNNRTYADSWWVVDMEGIMVDCAMVQSEAKSSRRLRSVSMHTRGNKDQVDEKDLASVALVVRAKFTDIKTINDQGTETAGPDGFDDDEQRDAAADGEQPTPLAEHANKWRTVGYVGISIAAVFVLGLGAWFWNKRTSAKSHDVDLASKYRPSYRPNLLIPRKMIEPHI